MMVIFVYLYILLLMTFCGDVKSLLCPTTASGWERASQALQCKPPNYYHCLRDSESGENTEQCLSKVWIQKEMCPEYNAKVSRIDVFQCSSSDCPPSLYWSNAVFIHPICFETSKATAATKPISEQKVQEGALSTSMGSLKSSRDDDTSNSLPVGAIVGIIIGIITIILISVAAILLYKRRRGKQNNGKSHDVTMNTAEEEAIESGTLLDVTMNTAEKEAIESGTLLDVTMNTAEEEAIESGTLLGRKTPKNSYKILENKGCPEGTNKSSTGNSLVYVVEGQEQSEQDQVSETDPYTRILVIVFSTSISEGKLLSQAQKIFGPECKLLSVLSFQKQSKERYETLFTKEFDIKDANSLQIFEKLREVVTINTEDARFVVGLPFSIWMKERDDLQPITAKNNDMVFQFVYC